MKRTAGRYWSSCCGEDAEYIGYYRCTGCQASLNLSHSQPPHITGNPADAERIRREKNEPEPAASGRLF